MNQTTDTSTVSLLACDDGFDPIEDRLRENISSTTETVLNKELDSFLGRLRYGREAGAVKVYRHGQRDRRITGTFGAETLSVLPARASRTRTARCANGARRRCRVTSA
jgi:transposase-like protein